jgi:predicted transcriptional regulator
MKFPLVFSVLLTLALLPVGCGKKDSTEAAAAVDTTKTESAFASAEPTIKAEFEKVITAVKGADWPAAGSAVQSLASNVKLSDEQKSALTSLAEQLKAKAAAAAEQAKQQAAKLAEDAKKATGQAVEEAGKLAEKAKDATSKAAQDASKAVGDLLPKK